MLDEQWSAVEADWQQYYGLDLAEAVYGKGGGPMTVRRITGLTLALPAEARCMKTLSDAKWSSNDTLLGLVIERLDVLTYTLVKVNGGKAPKPDPIVPRPKRSRSAVSTEDALAKLDAVLAGSI